jgi:serralysin
LDGSASISGGTAMERALVSKAFSLLIIFILGIGSLLRPAPVRNVLAKPQNEELTETCTEIGPSSLSATALSDRVWKGKQVLRVRFLDGSDYLQGKVRLYSQIWSKYANITFEFDEGGPSDLRISFVHDGRSWSYIGNSAENVNKNKATMNFGWFDESTNEVEFRRTILHEFGHALGLIHEHQSPKAQISWNKQFLYSYYSKPPFEWNQNVVRDNIIDKYAITRTQYSSYDSYSIMHYPIPGAFTTDGYSVGLNTDLSAKDKAFIKKLYP